MAVKWRDWKLWYAFRTEMADPDPHNLVRLFELTVTPSVTFYSMELVRGVNLHNWLAQRCDLTPEAVVVRAAALLSSRSS